MSRLKKEGDKFKDAHVDSRSKQNYLSFAIVGAFLTFNKTAPASPLAVFGIAVLLANAYFNYLHIDRYRRVNMNNFTSHLKALYQRFEIFKKKFAEFIASPNTSVETLWVQEIKDFANWQFDEIEKEEFRPLVIEKYYFFLFGLGLVLMSLGVIIAPEYQWFGLRHALAMILTLGS